MIRRTRLNRGTSTLKRSGLKRGTVALKRTGRPNPKRSKPRKGRITDRKFLTWAATQPCCISGELTATSHHVREYGSPKNDRRIIRLAARYHLHESGMLSIERISKADFERVHGISIEAEISKLNAAYEAR